MNSHHLIGRPFGILMIAVACGSGILFAQQKAAPPTTDNNSKTAGYDLQIVNGDLLLPGRQVEATLGNVIDSLRDQYTQANIVYSPSLQKIKVGDLKLRTGRLADELEALRVATGERFEFTGPSAPNPPIDPTTGQPLAGAMNLNAGLFVLRAPGPIPEKRREVSAFNISPYLEWLRRQQKDSGKNQVENELVDSCLNNIKTILDATIKDLNQGSEDYDRPSFQYHPGATLLVIVGTSDSIAVATKIVNALPGMSSATANFTGPYRVTEPPMTPQQSAADEAFRKRYGLMPGRTPDPNSGSAQPGAK